MDFLKRIPSEVDYEGQRLAEKIFQIIICLAALVGFAWGYILQQFSITVYSLIGGFALSCLIVLPPWPFYRRHPLKWLKAKPDSSSTSKADTIQKKQKPKKA